MKYLPIIIVIFFSFPSCSSFKTETPDNLFVLGKGEVHKIKKGATLEEIINVYGKDSAQLIYFDEEEKYPGLEIHIDGKHSITVDLDVDKTVNRLFIHDERFKTENGIGVGSTLGEVEENLDAEIVVNMHSDGILAIVEEMGLTLVFDAHPDGKNAEWFEDEAKSKTLVKVEEVMVFRLETKKKKEQGGR